MTIMLNPPRPEYPRPQFERSQWTNLNGDWTYKIIMRPPYFFSKSQYTQEEHSTGFAKHIVVPFPPESRLSTVEEKEIISLIFYHRELEIPEQYAGKTILLHFGAVFYHAQIFLDGVVVDFHDGGSSSFTVDITHHVQPGSIHHLVVKATSNLWDGNIPSGKQSCFVQSYKCFYTRITGIWQTVWMEAVHPCALESVHMIPNIDTQEIMVTPEFHRQETGMVLLTEIIAEGKTLASRVCGAQGGTPFSLHLDECHLWSPQDPFLYTVRFSVMDASQKIVDSVTSYIGMRKIHTAEGKVYLNNQAVFQRLVLDQGYYPEGLWTAPSDADIRKDIELGLAAGFNGARLHQKVFEERYYYWADRLGYLCWGESASWGLDYCTEGMPARNFLSEWAQIMRRDRNHPCIVAWTPLNETFQFTNGMVHRRLHRDAYQLCKSIDPSRPVNDSSGYIHFITDLWTVHTYEQDPSALKTLLSLDESGLPFRNYPEYESDYSGQPYLVDEYGGIKWDPETQDLDDTTHGQNLVSWGYGEAPRSLEELYVRLEKLTEVLVGLGHVAGYCYTQLTDVEQEKNGLYYYDRSKKFDMSRIAGIFGRKPY
jgi:beta-galactosidase/beta-glucuronidase